MNWRWAKARIDFNGTSGRGQAGTEVVIFTVTGNVLVPRYLPTYVVEGLEIEAIESDDNAENGRMLLPIATGQTRQQFSRGRFGHSIFRGADFGNGNPTGAGVWLEGSIQRRFRFDDTELWTIDGNISYRITASTDDTENAGDGNLNAYDHDIVDGILDIYCPWVPMEAGASVVGSTDLDDILTLQSAYEGSETFQDFLRLARAALYGELAGAATTTITMRDLADTKNRISATVDEDGNRTALTLDPD